MGDTPISPSYRLFNYIRESVLQDSNPQNQRGVERRHKRDLLTRLNVEFDCIRKKRGDRIKVLEAIRLVEDSIREIDELLKTLSDKF